MKNTLIWMVVTSTALFLAGCGMQAKPTPEDVAGVVTKRFNALGIRFKDLTITELNCASEAPKWRCTFTSTSRGYNMMQTIMTGKETYNEQLTVSPNVQMILIKGDAGWMETH